MAHGERIEHKMKIGMPDLREPYVPFTVRREDHVVIVPIIACIHLRG